MKKAKKYYVYDKPYVFIVLEHADSLFGDAIIHGVYSTLESAKGKYYKVISNNGGVGGYLCILKKPIYGKRVKHQQSFWAGTLELVLSSENS